MGVGSPDACQSAGASCGVVGSSLCIAPGLVANSKRYVQPFAQHQFASIDMTPVLV
jgi:hypothetical protein